jgi:UDP-N-acetylmuramate--alanine ligase
MLDKLPAPPAHIHIIGIGGAGMSPIARVLLGRGYTVSGSDRQKNTNTAALEREGATIYEGHAAENITGAQLVLITSAAQADNPEIVAAEAVRIPVLKRRDALGAITAGYDVIAVAGTHGKTTTSALITHLLMATGHDPTYIIGGTLLNTGSNAGVGKSQWFVIEADEYDYMFLGLQPKIAVITNIEHDHPDMFPGLEDVLNAFRQFAERIRPDGMLVGLQDDPNVAAIMNHARLWRRLVVPYGGDNAGRYVSDLLVGYGAMPPTLSGYHNLLNSFAAALVTTLVHQSKEGIGAGLSSFRGTGRRMEFMGIAATGAQIYNDYGHHPTALRATLQGARSRFGDAKIWAVWQPHTYSRTNLLAQEFSEAFKGADHALITDIYASREQPPPDHAFTKPGDLAHMAREAGHPDARASGDLLTTAKLLRLETQPGDVVIIFSAGDAPRIGEMLIRGEV